MGKSLITNTLPARTGTGSKIRNTTEEGRGEYPKSVAETCFSTLQHPLSLTHTHAHTHTSSTHKASSFLHGLSLSLTHTPKVC